MIVARKCIKKFYGFSLPERSPNGIVEGNENSIGASLRQLIFKVYPYKFHNQKFSATETRHFLSKYQLMANQRH